MVQGVIRANPSLFREGCFFTSCCQKLRDLVNAVRRAIVRFFQCICPCLFRKKKVEPIAPGRVEPTPPVTPTPLPSPQVVQAVPIVLAQPAQPALLPLAAPPQQAALPVAPAQPPVVVQLPLEPMPVPVAQAPLPFAAVSGQLNPPVDESPARTPPARVLSSLRVIPPLGTLPRAVESSSSRDTSASSADGYDLISERGCFTARDGDVVDLPSSGSMKDTEDEKDRDGDFSPLSPRASGPAVRPLPSPKVLVKGDKALTPEQSKAGIFVALHGLDLLWSLALQTDVKPEHLSMILELGITMYTGNKGRMPDTQPIPFGEILESLEKFEPIALRDNPEAGSLPFGGRLCSGRLTVLMNSLTGGAKDQGCLGALLFDGALDKNPKVYAVFVQRNDRQATYDYYILDPYQKNEGDSISWHWFRSISNFREYFSPGGVYSIVGLVKKDGSEDHSSTNDNDLD